MSSPSCVLCCVALCCVLCCALYRLHGSYKLWVKAIGRVIRCLEELDAKPTVEATMRCWLCDRCAVLRWASVFYAALFYAALYCAVLCMFLV